MVGGSGYIGSVLCPLLAYEHDVTVFDLHPPHDSMRFIPGDVRYQIPPMKEMDAVMCVIKYPS